MTPWLRHTWHTSTECTLGSTANLKSRWPTWLGRSTFWEPEGSTCSRPSPWPWAAGATALAQGGLKRRFVYARRAHEAGDALDNAQLRALRAMEAEPYLYQGDWNAAIEAAERALPAAWEIREWNVVGCASAWLAMSYLKLGKIDDARRVLDRVFKEAPLRAFGQVGVHGVLLPRIALAQLHLAAGDTSQALSAANTALQIAEEKCMGLEQGMVHRIFGEINRALGNRAEADAAFRRSLEALDQIQSRPELAQTLLAYGRFRQGDNRQEDRMLIQRALRLFEEMGATGWIQEARAALAAA